MENIITATALDNARNMQRAFNLTVWFHRRNPGYIKLHSRYSCLWSHMYQITHSGRPARNGFFMSIRSFWGYHNSPLLQQNLLKAFDVHCENHSRKNPYAIVVQREGFHFWLWWIQGSRSLPKREDVFSAVASILQKNAFNWKYILCWVSWLYSWVSFP